MNLVPIHPRLSTVRLELHHAAQIPAAASRLIDAQEDYSHTTLSLVGSQLQSKPLKDGRRVSVDVATLDLKLIGSDAPSSRFELEARRIGDGFAWLAAQLGAELAPLEHDLPSRPDAPFIVTRANAQLLDWIRLGWQLLQEVAGEHGGAEVQLWPHHFDMATLIQLEAAAEDARSINVGLSFGDTVYDEPYWYVTPWPAPAQPLPALKHGQWHTSGFTAAVLPATLAGDDMQAAAEAFLAEAIAASRELLAD